MKEIIDNSSSAGGSVLSVSITMKMENVVVW